MYIEQKVLRQFHLSSRYKGYHILNDAIALYVNNYNRYICLQKDIYLPLSNKYNTSVYAIEANIRTAIERCWKNDKSFMSNMFGYKLTHCPSNGEFIDFAAYYIKENMS